MKDSVKFVAYFFIRSGKGSGGAGGEGDLCNTFKNKEFKKKVVIENSYYHWGPNSKLFLSNPFKLS